MAAWIVLALWISLDLSADLDRPPAVHLRVDQDGRLSRDQLRFVVDEVKKIWGTAGVRVTWGQFGDPIPAGSAVVSMRFVTIESPRDRKVLGWVKADVHDQPTPTLFICISGVRDLLENASRSYAAVIRDRLTAQAMGRVAAHELGHYFVRGTAHDERGLMRPVYSATELLGPSLKPFQVAPSTRRVLRLEVARLRERQCNSVEHRGPAVRD